MSVPRGFTQTSLFTECEVRFIYVTNDKMCKFSESKVGERMISTSETEEKYNKDVELTDLRN
jgi:hypothetical protein